MKIIVTPYHIHYLQYCKENGLNPREHCFVDIPEKVYGLRFKKEDVVYLEDWPKVGASRDYDIEELINSRIVKD